MIKKVSFVKQIPKTHFELTTNTQTLWKVPLKLWKIFNYFFGFLDFWNFSKQIWERLWNPFVIKVFHSIENPWNFVFYFNGYCFFWRWFLLIFLFVLLKFCAFWFEKWFLNKINGWKLRKLKIVLGGVGTLDWGGREGFVEWKFLKI